MYFPYLRCTLRAQCVSTLVFYLRSYPNIADGVIHDAAPTLYPTLNKFRDVIRFHCARLNVISFTPIIIVRSPLR